MWARLFHCTKVYQTVRSRLFDSRIKLSQIILLHSVGRCSKVNARTIRRAQVLKPARPIRARNNQRKSRSVLSACFRVLIWRCLVCFISLIQCANNLFFTLQEKLEVIQEEHRAQLERMQQKLTETENNLTRLQQEKQQQPQQSRVVRSRSPPDLTLPRGTEERRPAEVSKPWCPPDIVVVLKLQRACSNVTWRSATALASHHCRF